MKKILFLLLLVISMNSCIGWAGADFTEPVIVTACELSYKSAGITDYYCVGRFSSSGFSLEDRFTFRDVTGKFNVGDTIQMIKVSK